MRYEFRLAARSLKEKRGLLRPIVDRVRGGMGVSIAETGMQDNHRQAEVGVAVVCGTPRECVHLADEIDRLVWARPDVEVVSCQRWWLEDDRAEEVGP